MGADLYRKEAMGTVQPDPRKKACKQKTLELVCQPRSWDTHSLTTTHHTEADVQPEAWSLVPCES